MSLRVGLHNLPAEALEAIAILLEFTDACNLRLVSTGIAAKIALGHFKTYFATKEIRIDSERDLRDFVRVTREGRVGNGLRHLIIAGTVHVEHINEADAQVVRQGPVEVLGEAFSNLRRHSSGKCLDSLSLTVKGIGREGEEIPVEDIARWSHVWDAAGLTFSAAMDALHESALPIRILDIYGETPRCSLAIDRFAAAWKGADLSTSFVQIERLSLNLSNHVIGGSKTEEAWTLQRAQEHTHAVCRFLQWCSTVRCLKLRWYTIKEGPLSSSLTEEKSFFRRMTKEVHFASLRDCTLLGIPLEVSDLLSFLEQVRLQRLCLNDINLTKPRSFAEVFQQIVRQEDMTYLHLENLFEKTLLCFDVPGEPPYPLSEPNGPALLIREGEKARDPIRYYRRKGFALGSPARHRWLKARALSRGPPLHSI